MVNNLFKTFWLNLSALKNIKTLYQYKELYWIVIQFERSNPIYNNFIEYKLIL